ncbi:hypothetical protein NDA01_23455 [Trichocoleus desertorum AS-A10]|uniref:helix-hairpin-helix domain-containing protein n=1 Tax=Trichocoleus desertorum TaxID=1481672 RepID=UPI003296C68B
MSYFDSTGHPLTFQGSPLGSGGEGTVWRTDRKGQVAKIYYSLDRSQTRKLELMIKNPPKDRSLETSNHISIAWPTDLINDSKGEYVGILMPAIDRSVELTKVYNPKLRKKILPGFTWKYLHVAAKNLAWIIRDIHAKGYVLGDMKPQNIRVNNSALVSIVDTDSFQVPDHAKKEIYRCTVFSPEFTPPELIGETASNITQTPCHDNFRLAVIIYQLLFGIHPFSTGEWKGSEEKPDIDRLIQQGYWIYSYDKKVQPSRSTISLNVVHPELKSLFLRCFNDGHQAPTLRPTANDWCNALEQAISELISCKHLPNHVYRKSYRRCHWCERSKDLGVDIFSVSSSSITNKSFSFKQLLLTNQSPSSNLSKSFHSSQLKKVKANIIRLGKFLIKIFGDFFWLAIVTVFILINHQSLFLKTTSSAIVELLQSSLNQLSKPSSTPSYSLTPGQDTCGGPNPPGIDTWYPVFVRTDDDETLHEINKFCKDAYLDGDKIQVASFLNRAKAEAFAEILKKRFGSGEVGAPHIEDHGR